VVWDEALTDEHSSHRLPQDALVIAWQSKERGRKAAAQGYDVVMAPHDHTYFNIHQAHGDVEPGHKGFLPWSKVRVFDAVPTGLDETAAKHVLGGEGALWSEFVETRADVETLTMPRAAALAEALWSGPNVPEADFIGRLGRQLPMLDAAHVGYFVEPPDLGRAKTAFLDGASANVSLTPPRLFPDGVTRYTRDGSEPTASSPVWDSPFVVRDTTTVAAAVFLPGGRASRAVHASFVKETPRPGKALADPKPGARYAYVEGDFHVVPPRTTPPRSRGRCDGMRLADVARAAGTSMRKEQFALFLDGFVSVPSDGIYRFVAKADDGVRVKVDGEDVVVDDGEHGPRESDGDIALAAGYHAVEVGFFQQGGGATLELDVVAPGGERAAVKPYLGAPASPRSP
jgi:hexosaminidase